MPKIYSIEPFMQDGQVCLPGDSIDVSADDAAAILSSGRGTMDAAIAKVAAKQYAAQQSVPAA